MPFEAKFDVILFTKYYKRHVSIPMLQIKCVETARLKFEMVLISSQKIE